MVKTKNYLKGRFETGDIPTGADYEDWMDSYWHKSELGQVANGNTQPVTGGAVYAAIAAMKEELEGKMQEMVAEVLSELLESALEAYVTTTALEEVLEDNATKTWVTSQLSDKAEASEVSELKGQIGDTPVKSTVTGDSKETREKVNEMIESLQGSSLLDRVDPLAVAE